MVSTPGGRRSLISPLAFVGGGAALCPTRSSNNQVAQSELIATWISCNTNNSTQQRRCFPEYFVTSNQYSLATTQALERQKEQQEQAQEARLHSNNYVKVKRGN